VEPVDNAIISMKGFASIAAFAVAFARPMLSRMIRVNLARAANVQNG
jgi:hypothetical protein